MTTHARSGTDGVDADASPAATLSAAQLGALVEAAAWYAKYQNGSIPHPDDDPSAAAQARREHFADLFDALEALGVRLRRPDAVRGMRRP